MVHYHDYDYLTIHSLVYHENEILYIICWKSQFSHKHLVCIYLYLFFWRGVGQILWFLTNFLYEYGDVLTWGRFQQSRLL